MTDVKKCQANFSIQVCLLKGAGSVTSGQDG